MTVSIQLTRGVLVALAVALMVQIVGLEKASPAWADACTRSHESSLVSQQNSFGVQAGKGCNPKDQSDGGSGEGNSPTPAPSEADAVPAGEADTSTESDVQDPNRIIAISQVYCMDIQGVAMMDCLQAESSACGPDGQWLIRAEYPANNQAAIEQVGTQFCSTESDPVIQDPAAGAEETEAPPMPVVTLADFRALDIAPSTIESDSGGFGLVRANTNFYATEEPQTLNTTMLGQAVAIQAVPVQWTWDYGDGSEARSNPFPGGPQREFNQETTTSHVYEDTGEFPVSLTTSYRGQFQVNGGPWIAIPGTAQVPSDPTTADIWRSKSKNVAENCVENPEGWACGNPFIEGEG